MSDALTFAYGNVAVFLLDVFVCSEAPRVGINSRQQRWVAAVVVDIMDDGSRMLQVISEVCYVIIHMLVGIRLAPSLTWYSGYSAI